MKVISLQSALPTAMLAIAFVAAGHAIAGEQVDCSARRRWVQGRVLQGLPWTVRPRLSRVSHHAATRRPAARVHRESVAEFRRAQPGQRYLHKHVQGAWPQPGDAIGCGRAFQRLSIPPPVGGGPRNLVATGQKIFEEGIPEANIPACSACHGPDAKGQAAIPRLAGQLYPYTVKQLSGWTKERGQAAAKDDTTAVMTSISHNLTPPQIDAIAAYLSYLR